MPASSPSCDVVDLDLEAAALGPAQVHAQEHLGPVLGLGAAGAGVDGDDGPALVVGAAEEALLLAALELALQIAQPRLELGEELAVDGVAGELLAHQLLRRLEVAELAFELGELLETPLQPAVLGRGLRGALLVVPEVGRAHALLEGGDVGFYFGGVKDSSAASSDARRRP